MRSITLATAVLAGLALAQQPTSTTTAPLGAQSTFANTVPFQLSPGDPQWNWTVRVLQSSQPNNAPANVLVGYDFLWPDGGNLSTALNVTSPITDNSTTTRVCAAILRPPTDLVWSPALAPDFTGSGQCTQALGDDCYSAITRNLTYHPDQNGCPALPDNLAQIPQCNTTFGTLSPDSTIDIEYKELEPDSYGVSFYGANSEPDPGNLTSVADALQIVVLSFGRNHTDENTSTRGTETQMLCMRANAAYEAPSKVVEGNGTGAAGNGTGSGSGQPSGADGFAGLNWTVLGLLGMGAVLLGL